MGLGVISSRHFADDVCVTPAGECGAGPVTMGQVPPVTQQPANGLTLPHQDNVLEHISSLLASLQVGHHSIDILSRRSSGSMRGGTAPRVLTSRWEGKLRVPWSKSRGSGCLFSSQCVCA